jgi:hypothetical protein
LLELKDQCDLPSTERLKLFGPMRRRCDKLTDPARHIAAAFPDRPWTNPCSSCFSFLSEHKQILECVIIATVPSIGGEMPKLKAFSAMQLTYVMWEKLRFVCR